MNILLTAVGRRAYLVEYFKEVVHPLGGKVYATNTTKDATGFMVADEAVMAPPSSSDGYVDFLLDQCAKWNIKLLFSLHDWDAPVIARAKERFLAQGTIPVMGSAELLATCLDKYATVEVMRKLGVPVPETALGLKEALKLARKVGYPLIVKPRWGQGSIGLFKVEDEEELRHAYRLSELASIRFARVCPEIDENQTQVIVQQCVVGEEYGCDIVNGLNGDFAASFVKHKFGMRSGETDIAESVEKPEIAALAKKIAGWSRHLGCMDSDWMIGADGVPYLIELNPRFGGGYPFTHKAGANIPAACVAWAAGLSGGSALAGFRPNVRTYKEIALLSV